MKNKLTLADFGSDFEQLITTQSYDKPPQIEGVRVIDLRLMVDDGGSFAEVVRLNETGSLEAFPEFQVRQTSFSTVLPGAIKAFHLHFNQEDVWFVPPYDRLLIGLVDVRKTSPTYKASMRFVLGGGRAKLMYVPRGVAHGCANIWDKASSVFYFVNQQFDITNPDERRLSHTIVPDDFWRITPG
ncbi:MAG: dTDP-4-dehydrorhamnose 3,5-epimerase family protein [Capsulimonadaceae bacterium]|nr:dTDP-4-dehydrorhamnose 3,5-epimerase family protein [Capsulimonadaceae bacterium]